jgi:hypothetical protein
MKKCPLCENQVEHLKKHMKLKHPEEYAKRYLNSNQILNDEALKVKRPHTCPVVYLQNFSRLSPNYLKCFDNSDYKTYQKPDRKDFLIYAHNKIKNEPFFETNLDNIGVRKNFYLSNKIERYLEQIETKVGVEFRKIRSMTISAYVDPFIIFRFMMSQLLRTPKFLQKIEKDTIYLKNMSDEEYSKSLMFLYNVQKPKEITKNILLKLQKDMILNNTLEKIYKWSRITLFTNHTSIPYITSDSPVIYYGVEFFPSFLKKDGRIEFSILFDNYPLFFFPIDPHFAFFIGKFDNKQEDAIIDYVEEFEERRVMLLNMLMYQYSEKMVMMKEKDDGLIENIRKLCKADINREYPSLEVSYESIKKRVEESNQRSV